MVEHSLGKGEVDSSILSGSTSTAFDSEALQAATPTGGKIMQHGHELGLVKEGYLADLVLIDGDPLKDVRVLQARNALPSS